MDIRHTIQLSILNIEPAGLMRFPAPEADECESVRRPGDPETRRSGGSSDWAMVFFYDGTLC